MKIEEILNISPYSLAKAEKTKMLDERLLEMTVHHYMSCDLYRRYIDALGVNISRLPSYDQLPFLPVRVFKEYDLASVPKEEVIKTMTSSALRDNRGLEYILTGQLLPTRLNALRK